MKNLNPPLRKLFLFLCLFFYTYAIQAQDRYYVLTLTVENGLSSQTSYNILKSPNGFIWISTRMGVDRYDGKDFRQYSLTNDEFRKAEDGFFNLMQADEKNQIWVVNNRGRVYKYNERGDRFQELFNTQNTIKDFIPLSLALSKEQIFIGSVNKGLASFSASSNKLLNTALENQQVTYILPYKKDFLLVGTNNGTFLLDSNLQVKEHLYASPAAVSALFYDEQTETIWIGTRGNGLWKKANTDTAPVLVSGSENTIITCIRKQDANTITVGCDGKGVLKTNPYGTEPLRIRDNDSFTSPYPLHAASVGDILIDNDAIWVTSKSGVTLFRKNLVFKRLQNQKAQVPTDKYVQDVTSDSHGNIWTTYNQMVQCHNLTDGSNRFYLEGKGNFLSIGEDKDGQIWCGGFNSGLYKLNPATGQYQFFSSLDGKNVNDCVYDIYCDPNGDVWVGGSNLRLTRITPKDGKYTYQHFDIPRVYCIKRLNEEQIVVGTAEGLYILNTKTYKFEHLFGEDEKDWEGVHLIHDIATYEGHEIWLAFDGSGLGCYDTKTKQLKNYTTKNGLPSNYIRSLVMDALKHTLWVGTANKGMFAFDCNHQKYKWGLMRQDGLMFSEFMQHASTILPDRRIVMGGSDGALLLVPDKLVERGNREFKIQFNKLELGNASLSPESHPNVITEPLDSITEIHLPYEQRSLRIHLCTDDVYHQTDYHFIYQFVGDNEDSWQSVDYDRTIDFVNLAPGTYKVEIRGANSHGLVASKTLTIYVEQVIWLRWYMIVLYIILLFALIYWRFKEWSESIKKRNTQKQVSMLVQTKSKQDEQDDEFMQKLTRTIEKHLSNSEFGVNDLCQEMAMSRSVLYEKVRKAMDTTPNYLINSIRMQHAKAKLEEGNTSVAEVSMACGFNDYRYFSSVFKKYYGELPSKLLKSQN